MIRTCCGYYYILFLPVAHSLNLKNGHLNVSNSDIILEEALSCFWIVLSSILTSIAAKSLQSCPALCNPVDGSPPGSTIPGILQERTLEWVAISFSNAWKWKVKSESEVAQSYPTLSDPMGCGLPGSSIYGIFQARVLEWGATAWLTSQMIQTGKNSIL